MREVGSPGRCLRSGYVGVTSEWSYLEKQKGYLMADFLNRGGMDWGTMKMKGCIGTKELGSVTMRTVDLVSEKNTVLCWLMSLRVQRRRAAACIPFEKWCHQEEQPNRLLYTELLRPRCYHSV